MPTRILGSVRKAITHLNPQEVRDAADRPLNIGMVAPTAEGLWRMEHYFCPSGLSPDRRAEVSRRLHRVSAGERSRSYDIEIWDDSLAVPGFAFAIDPERPELTVQEVLKRRPDLALPLARFIPPFRKPVIAHLIHTVSNENAVFALATALPDVLPGVLSLPWAVGEFASDTAFLTMNQIRMTFLIAAASDRPVGYREQKGEIGSIMAGAFGFRSLARELLGKIPLGGGLIPKAAVAWAGTYVIGQSMERLYRSGYAFSRKERRSAYRDALEKGKEIASGLLEMFRRPQTS